MDDREKERALALREQAKQTEDELDRDRLEDDAAEAEGSSLLGVGHLRIDPRRS